MPAPDFPKARRQLRRARVEDALQLKRVVNLKLNRDRLLEPLVIAADLSDVEFDTLHDDEIDTVVSIALTELDEPPTDALAVVLLCLRVLAVDGQFARLKLLADRLSSLAERVEPHRPFLSKASLGLALCLRGMQLDALSVLDDALAGGRDVGAVRPQSREDLNDILMASTLRMVLTQGEVGYAEKARSMALRIEDGLLLAFVDAVNAWHTAQSRARPSTVLAAADSAFGRAPLLEYVENRGITALFPPQIKAIENGATLDINHIVSLPTSSGKTLLAEFRVAAALTRSPGSRAIYVAPYRLLARQVQRSFSQGLASLGFVVQDLGSGFDPALDDSIMASGRLPDVVICTPERLDSLIRLSTRTNFSGLQAAELLSSCSVLIFDELQLIARAGRGPRFELLLARIRSHFPNWKVLGLTAASHETNDLARWLTDSEPIAGARRPTGTLEISWGVDGKLRQRAGNVTSVVAELPRTRAVDDAASLILSLDPRYRPVLAVETSRTQAESLARRLADRGADTSAAWRQELTSEESKELNAAIEEVASILGEEHPLTRFMGGGIAFHHAGVPTSVLRHIEALSASRLLRVVCSTTTVAEGADLPFRVVVIPHLNFPGSSGQLDRDLYLNIIGRAGRANVSVEGMVFVLASEAPTLRSLIRDLWSTTHRDQVRGTLENVTSRPVGMDDYAGYLELQSQVLAWLGERDSYTANQAESFAAKTLTWSAGRFRVKRQLVGLIDDALHDLGRRGYALAASPYRLTERGAQARLTGLSPPSIERLLHGVETGRFSWVEGLVGATHLSEEVAESIARLLLEGVEVVQHSLWLRKTARSEAARFDELGHFVVGANDEQRYGSEHYLTDVMLLKCWIGGMSYAEIAEAAPVFSSPNSLFGGTNISKRTSDAAEYTGKMTYPASWVWSGARLLLGRLGDQVPAFIRSSIELGVPSESSARLIAKSSMTRTGALRLSALGGSSWEEFADWLSTRTAQQVSALDVTLLDRRRTMQLRRRLLEADGSQ